MASRHIAFSAGPWRGIVPIAAFSRACRGIPVMAAWAAIQPRRGAITPVIPRSKSPSTANAADRSRRRRLRFHIVEPRSRVCPRRSSVFRRNRADPAPLGLIHLVLSQPDSRAKGADFTVAPGTHGYFHLSGRDFAEPFRLRERGLALMIAGCHDPITGANELTHMIAKSSAQLAGIRATLAAGLFNTEDGRDFMLALP